MKGDEMAKDKESLYDRAAARVDNDPRLSPHREFILADWPEGDEHWAWVIAASTEEILSWVDAGSP
jgi:hypothetical protein